MNRRSFIKLSLSGGALALAGWYPTFIERNIVQVNRYKIPIPNLPLSFQGFTLAHVTDVHLGSLVSPLFVEEIVHQTNSLIRMPLFVPAIMSMKEIRLKKSIKYGLFYPS